MIWKLAAYAILAATLAWTSPASVRAAQDGPVQTPADTGADGRSETGRAAAAATAPAAIEPAPLPGPRSNYRIGAGDVLDVRVLGEDKLSALVKVSEDGLIRFPFVDEDLMVQCLTERELSDVIAGKLKKYLKYPEVFVSVKEYNSTPVAIMGAVSSPGRFAMQRRVRLIELLTFAGGVRSDAGKEIHIIHLAAASSCNASAPKSAEPAIDLVDASETVSVTRLLKGDVSADRVMQPGDIVIVPTADLVFVAGEVLKPNAYPLREGLTLTQAVAIAGGPSPIAKVSAIRIVRQEPGKPRQEINVDLKAIQNNKAPDPVLIANDVIEIPDSSGRKIVRNLMSALTGSASQLPLRVIP